MLVLEAAHQAAAGTRNLSRVERQILFLCHIDGHRLKVAQIGRAAQFTTTDAQTTDHLGLIAYANLAQLDAGAEDGSQILDQTAEVYTAICREVEQDLVEIEGALDSDQTHVQLVFLDLAPCNLVGFLGLTLVFAGDFQIAFGRDADDFLERRDDFAFGHLSVAHGALAALDTACGLHDDALSALDRDAAGVKIVYFADSFESDTNDSQQSKCSSVSVCRGYYLDDCGGWQMA